MDSEVEGRTSEIEDLLAEIREKVPEELAELEHQREQLTQRITMLRNLQRTFNPSKPKPKAKAGSNGTPRTGPSPERMLKVAEAINSLGEGAVWTAMDLHHQVLGNPWSEPTTYIALKELRELEYIGKQGKGKNNSDQFTVLDGATIDRIREMFEA